ncbi:hypothetical protein INT45_004527 [Circinella minor]|uniref:Uncharacterized protein n=1 Tax=Circinella minor TaxID=1195481 RepID=A0A8H7S4X7_9FUNG|nr:hypothetical protein INT45_004527 [Circinella minor]
MQGPTHFIRHYASHHCKCQYDNNNNDDNDISRHLSQDHLQDIFNNSIRSAFSRHEHPALDTMRYKYYDPVKDSDHTENQFWKETPFGYDQVHVIEWVIDSCPASKLSHYLPQLVPPMLLIIDDYDVEYKVRGVHILHRMIKKISVDNDPTLRRVDNVFIATLFNCLTYLSNQSHIPLLEASYPCLMDLISKTKASGTKQRAELFEKIMVNGILLGLQYGQSTSNVRQVLFEQLPRIYTEMNVLGVQYLKVYMIHVYTYS